jgi:cullin-associated NEDD8-dissociated protein 1
VTPYVNKIVKLALEFVKYDPNYHYDDDDEKGSSGGGSGGKSGGGGDDGDDKEASWDDDGDGGWGNDNEDGGQKLMEEGDDDSSWKARSYPLVLLRTLCSLHVVPQVRRAAVRCLSAFIRARSDILKEYYETVRPNRFFACLPAGHMPLMPFFSLCLVASPAMRSCATFW